MNRKFIRNFCIIAHIDHGKSTLADRILEVTGAVNARTGTKLILDDMELERERGITIKSSAVSLNYKSKDGGSYTLNLIDTPGHVDFSYEVSKSIYACEGAVLLVDATQGVQAQTLANFHMALDRRLKIIPVINKIDVSNIDLELVRQQMVDILHFREEELILASAKEGIGVIDILERVIKEVPGPSGDEEKPLQALVFDSQYDTFRGVIVHIRITNGKLCKNDRVLFMHAKKAFQVGEMGILSPMPEEVDCLSAGEVGFFNANIKEPKDVLAGDTLTHELNPASNTLPGYKQIKPMVFCGIFPVNSKDYPLLRDALDKLHLNDSSFIYEPENSTSCGFGFRCGFLGLLHMEIVQERLEREFGLDLVLTSPNVIYRVETEKEGEINVDNPSKLPQPQFIKAVKEPFIRVLVVAPSTFMDAICNLVKERRGNYISSSYLGESRLEFIFEMPLSEAIVDFYDQLKSATKGYGSVDYEFIGFRPADLVKLDVMINGEKFDSFAQLVDKAKAQGLGRKLVSKLRELIPRQLFEIRIQAAIGTHVIAAERLSPVGKNVTSKCYGGDITRKRKLWEKQKQGKKRLKQFGRIQIPQEAFLAAIKIR